MKTPAHSEIPAELDDVAEHPFLRGLSESQLQALANCAMRVHFAAGDLVFREGDPANRFYLLIKGRIALTSQQGERILKVQTIKGGDVLGWSWLFPPYYTHFDARAIEPTEAMFFYGTRLRELCEDDHDLGYEMLRRIAQVVIHRLQAAEKQLVATSEFMKAKTHRENGRQTKPIGDRAPEIPSIKTESWLKPHPNFRLQKILVPVDFSERSQKALQYALALAQEFASELILTHVIQPYPILTEMPSTMAELQVELEKAANAQLDKLRQSVRNAPCRGIVRIGHAVHQILSVAREEDVDVIIIATHGRTGLAHTVLGSVAERVVRHAGCPVLIVREKEHEFLVTQPDNPELRTKGI